MTHENRLGHLAAFGTIVIWGTTFISTKILLAAFQPIEILFFRFVLGFFALCIVSPRRMKKLDGRQELTCAAAGLTGVCLYYLLENIALTYTLASNVGVILSVAPCFTAILTRLLSPGEEPLRPSFFAGFAVAMIGICLISFQGGAVAIHPIGDLLAVLAALLWAVYSVLTKKIGSFGCPTILATRRVFFYGLLFMLPCLFLFDMRWDLTRFANPVYLFQILFLGLGASAFCFVTWNFAVRVLGAVKTTIYIYMVPVITVAAAALVLHERITGMAAVGAVLTLAGLAVSEYRPKHKTV